MSSISRLSIYNDNLFDDTIGSGGISLDALKALSPRLDGLRQQSRDWLKSKTPNFLNLPFTTDAHQIKRQGQEFARRFTRTVVFGIGGSSLGGEMLVRTLGGRSGRRKVSFFDNVDPTTLEALDRIDWKETQLLVISKSGNTAVDSISSSCS